MVRWCIFRRRSTCIYASESVITTKTQRFTSVIYLCAIRSREDEQSRGSWCVDRWVQGSWSGVWRSRWRCRGTCVEWRRGHEFQQRSAEPSRPRPRWWCLDRHSYTTTHSEPCALSIQHSRPVTHSLVNMRTGDVRLLSTYGAVVENFIFWALYFKRLSNWQCRAQLYQIYHFLLICSAIRVWNLRQIWQVFAALQQFLLEVWFYRSGHSVCLYIHTAITQPIMMTWWFSCRRNTFCH